MELHDIALSKAKIKLMSKPDSAFFTTLCFGLRHSWNPNIPTARTDGLYVEYSPAFFMGLSPNEQVFLLLHETLHAAYDHRGRVGSKDPRRWNRACDYVINAMLIERNFKMPEGGLYDPQYAGMSAEEVYELLSDKDSLDDLLMEDLQPFAPDTLETTRQQEIKELLIRASMQSKLSGDTHGSIPGDIAVYLDKILNPVLPWEKILAKHLNKHSKNDYSFAKLNRRYFPEHFMPSLHSKRMIDIAVAVDTSASVSDADFTAFISEVSSILRRVRPGKATTLQFDTRVHSVNEVKNVRELLGLSFRGRGGTEIKCVLDWAAENKPEVLMVFTDGEFNIPESIPKRVDIIWVIYGNHPFTPPVGRVIRYKGKV